MYEPVTAYNILAKLGKVIAIFDENDHAETSWSSTEYPSLVDIQVTLKDVITFTPIDQNFAQMKEVTLAVDLFLQSIWNLDEALRYCIPDWNSKDGIIAASYTPSKMVFDHQAAIVGHVMELRKQAQKYLPVINTLHLLYLIDVLTSPPFEVLSADELSTLRSLHYRSMSTNCRELDRINDLFSNGMLNVENQQQCLALMRRQAESQRRVVQMTIHGVWYDAKLHKNKHTPYVESTHSGSNEIIKSSAPDLSLEGTPRGSSAYHSVEKSNANQKQSNDHGWAGTHSRAEGMAYQVPSLMRQEGPRTAQRSSESTFQNSYSNLMSGPTPKSLGVNMRKKYVEPSVRGLNSFEDNPDRSHDPLTPQGQGTPKVANVSLLSRYERGSAHANTNSHFGTSQPRSQSYGQFQGQSSDYESQDSVIYRSDPQNNNNHVSRFCEQPVETSQNQYYSNKKDTSYDSEANSVKLKTGYDSSRFGAGYVAAGAGVVLSAAAVGASSHIGDAEDAEDAGSAKTIEDTDDDCCWFIGCWGTQSTNDEKECCSGFTICCSGTPDVDEEEEDCCCWPSYGGKSDSTMVDDEESGCCCCIM